MPDDGDRAQQINEQLQTDAFASHFRNTQGRGPHHDGSTRRPLLSAQGEGGGICIDCDEPIDPRRLEVQPHALRCIDCQRDFETLSRGVK